MGRSKSHYEQDLKRVARERETEQRIRQMDMHELVAEIIRLEDDRENLLEFAADLQKILSERK